MKKRTKKPVKQFQAPISKIEQLSKLLSDIQLTQHLDGETLKRDVSNIIVKTNHLFTEIKQQPPSEQRTNLLKICALIGAACPAIDNIKIFQLAFNMLLHYLNGHTEDTPLMEACAQMRDRFYQKLPDVQRPGLAACLSDVFTKHLEPAPALFVTPLEGLSDPDHDMPTLSHPVADHPKVSFLELKNEVEALKNKINQGYKVSEKKWNVLFERLFEYIRDLKREYLLDETVMDTVDHPVKIALECTIELQNTLIAHFKTHKKLPFIWLEVALKRKAQLLHTLSKYYEKTTEAISEEDKKTVSNELALVQSDAFHTKNLIILDWIIASSETSPDEKQRATTAKAKQLALRQEPVPTMPSEGGIFAYYPALNTHFEHLNNSVFPVSLAPLCNKLLDYVQQCFIACSGNPNLNIFHIDGAWCNDHNFELSSTSAAAIFENSAHLWPVLSLYYHVIIKNNEQIMKFYPEANNVADYNVMENPSFFSAFRLEGYRYVFEDYKNNPSLKERKKRFYYLSTEEYYAPPLLRALAKVLLECVEKEILEHALSEKDQTLPQPEVTSQITLQTLDLSPKKESKKEKKAREKRESEKKKADEQQILTASRVYVEKQLIFRQTWGVCRTQIMSHLQNKNLQAALTQVNEALEGDFLNTTETNDARILKATILREMGSSREDLSDVLNETWKAITLDTTTSLLYYMQRETVSIHRYLNYFTQGDHRFAGLMLDVCKDIAREENTFCFPVLFSELSHINNFQIAVQMYQEPVKKLLDTNTPLLVNEYHMTEFIMFYQWMSAYYYEQGKKLWKTNELNKLLGYITEALEANQSHTYYFEQSISILQRLRDYATYYQPEWVFDLSLSLIKLYRKVDACEHHVKHEREVTALLNWALKSAKQEKNQDHIVKIQQLVPELLNNVNNKKIVKQEFERTQRENSIEKIIQENIIDSKRLGPEASITELEINFEERIQLRILDIQIALFIKILAPFYDEFKNLYSQHQTNKRAFDERLNTLSTESIVLIAAAFHDSVKKAEELATTPCDDSSIPPDALIHKYNILCRQFMLLHFTRQIEGVMLNIGMSSEKTESFDEFYNTIKTDLNKLIHTINSFEHTNRRVAMLSLADCYREHLAKTNIKNLDLCGAFKDDDMIPIKLYDILLNVHAGNKLTHQAAFNAGQLMFWAIETFKTRLYPNMETTEAKEFLTILFKQYQTIARSFYQKASAPGLFSHDYITERKKTLKCMSLAPEVLDEEDQKQSAAIPGFGP